MGQLCSVYAESIPMSSSSFPMSSSSSGRGVVDEDDDNAAGEGQEQEEEELDPRVQEELEKLNTCTEEINQLEIDLEDANCLFQSLLSDSTHQLNTLAKKLGNCIEKVRNMDNMRETMHGSWPSYVHTCTLN